MGWGLLLLLLFLPCDDMVPLVYETLKGRENAVKAPFPNPQQPGGSDGLDLTFWVLFCPKRGVHGDQVTGEGGQLGTFQQNRAVCRVSQKMAKLRCRSTRKHAQKAPRAPKEKFTGNLATGPARLFVCWSQAHRVQSEGFPTSCQRPAFPLSFLLGLISCSAMA